MVRLRSSMRYSGALFVVGEAQALNDVGNDFVDVAGDVTMVMVFREDIGLGSAE